MNKAYTELSVPSRRFRQGVFHLALTLTTTRHRTYYMRRSILTYAYERREPLLSSIARVKLLPATQCRPPKPRGPFLVGGSPSHWTPDLLMKCVAWCNNFFPLVHIPPYLTGGPDMATSAISASSLLLGRVGVSGASPALFAGHSSHAGEFYSHGIPVVCKPLLGLRA